MGVYDIDAIAQRKAPTLSSTYGGSSLVWVRILGQSGLGTIVYLDTGAQVSISGETINRVGQCVVILDGYLYSIGGYLLPSETMTNAVYRFNLNNPSGGWESCGALITTVYAAFAVAYDGKIYLFGGRTSPATTNSTDTVQCYDPSENLWSVHGTMSYSCYYHGGILVDDVVHLFGGVYAGTVRTYNSTYTITTGVAATKSAFPAALYYPLCAVEDDTIHILGDVSGGLNTYYTYENEATPTLQTWPAALPRNTAYPAMLNVGSVLYNWGQRHDYTYNFATETATFKDFLAYVDSGIDDGATYSTSRVFTVSGNYTSTFIGGKNLYIQYSDGSEVRGEIDSSTYSGGVTTVTLSNKQQLLLDKTSAKVYTAMNTVGYTAVGYL